MISLEQIKTLDDKVKKAVGVIGDLRAENTKLKQKLNDYQSRIEELEQLIEDFKRDQGAIEQGILDAIDQLDHLEHAPSASATVPEETPEKTDSKADPDETPPAIPPTIKQEHAIADTAAPGETSPETGTENDNSAVEEEPDDQDSSELDIF